MFSNKLNKYQKNYDYLVAVLKKAQIDTVEKVQVHLNKVLIKVLWFSLAVFIVVAILYWLNPVYYPIWGIIAILALAWGWVSALSAIKIMRQYIKDELQSGNLNKNVSISGSSEE